MLGYLFKPCNKNKIHEERSKWLDEMIAKSIIMRKLISNDKTGWKEFIYLIDDYIDKARKRKAITAMDRASETEIQELKYLDHEIYILQWVKKIPEQFIDQVDKQVKENNGQR